MKQAQRERESVREKSERKEVRVPARRAWTELSQVRGRCLGYVTADAQAGGARGGAVPAEMWAWWHDEFVRLQRKWSTTVGDNDFPDLSPWAAQTKCS